MKIVYRTLRAALPASPEKYIINFLKNTSVFLAGFDTTNYRFSLKIDN